MLAGDPYRQRGVVRHHADLLDGLGRLAVLQRVPEPLEGDTVCLGWPAYARAETAAIARSDQAESLVSVWHGLLPVWIDHVRETLVSYVPDARPREWTK